MPSQTLEVIKGQRKSTSYKKLVKDILIEERHLVEIGSGQSAVSGINYVYKGLGKGMARADEVAQGPMRRVVLQVRANPSN